MCAVEISASRVWAVFAFIIDTGAAAPQKNHFERGGLKGTPAGRRAPGVWKFC